MLRLATEDLPVVGLECSRSMSISAPPVYGRAMEAPLTKVQECRYDEARVMYSGVTSQGEF